MSGKTKIKGFTIIELLTVMTIIIILLSVLVPGLNRMRIYAKTVTQHGQFHDISNALELFRNDHQENYPDSGAGDPCGIGYCGAMKLCEALVGQDGMGFHPSSRFLADGTGIEPNGATPELYLFDLCTSIDPAAYTPALRTNLRERIRYIEVENIKAVRLQDLFTWTVDAGVSNFSYPPTPATVAFDNDPLDYPNAVITDVFQRASIQSSCAGRAGEKAGMPVLYYKADSSKLDHDTISDWTAWVSNFNIYNFDDNYALTMLGCPWESGMGINPHPMYTDPRVFLREITNKKVTTTPRPHNENSYILMSAGWDGLYGTRDDVFNFAD
jgi:type II secretory pathway pseudopilin PulG